MFRHETLLAQLQTYTPADAVEAGHRQAMVRLLTGSVEAFSRSHFTPGHFTAGCFIVDDGGRLLLHHHKRLSRWLQMGGHIEGEEWPEAAALREGFEESGLSDLALSCDILDLDVHPIPAGRGEPDHAHFDVRYLARTANAAAVSIDPGESNELAWVGLDRAAELMPGEESRRVLHKIATLLATGGSV